MLLFIEGFFWGGWFPCFSLRSFIWLLSVSRLMSLLFVHGSLLYFFYFTSLLLLHGFPFLVASWFLPAAKHCCQRFLSTFVTLRSNKMLKQSNDSCSSRQNHLNPTTQLWLWQTHRSAEKSYILWGLASFYGYSIRIFHTFILRSRNGLPQNSKGQFQPNKRQKFGARHQNRQTRI